MNISGLKFNTVHANDFKFYEELNEVVQHEPANAVDPETVGLFAAIGIKKGKQFAPDARMKAILTEAVAVGNATSRTIVFAPRDPRQKFFADRQWTTGFLGGYRFLDGGERVLDGRTLFLYYATGITPAMAPSKPGVGSAYAYTARDSRGAYLDGGKNYKVTLPGPIPPPASGRSRSTTTRPARCSKPTRSAPVSTARARHQEERRRLGDRSTSGRRLPQVRKATGSRPCRARAGT